MNLEKWYFHKKRRVLRWIVRHLLLFALSGLALLFILYYNILHIRTNLVDGYFSDPFLSVTSQVIWFAIGGMFFVLGTAIKQMFKNKKRGRRK